MAALEVLAPRQDGRDGGVDSWPVGKGKGEGEGGGRGSRRRVKKGSREGEVKGKTRRGTSGKTRATTGIMIEERWERADLGS